VPEYSVPIVHRDSLKLWHEFWDQPLQTQPSIDANRDGSLGQTAHIKARNKNDAAKIAENQNPGYVAIRDAIQRIG